MQRPDQQWALRCVHLSEGAIPSSPMPGKHLTCPRGTEALNPHSVCEYNRKETFNTKNRNCYRCTAPIPLSKHMLEFKQKCLSSRHWVWASLPAHSTPIPSRQHFLIHRLTWKSPQNQGYVLWPLLWEQNMSPSTRAFKGKLHVSITQRPKSKPAESSCGHRSTELIVSGK